MSKKEPVAASMRFTALAVEGWVLALVVELAELPGFVVTSTWLTLPLPLAGHSHFQ